MREQSSAPAEAKKILTLEKLADILRKNCEGFDEKQYKQIREVPSVCNCGSFFTKYVHVDFHLAKRVTLVCSNDYPITIRGRTNYDATKMTNDFIFSEAAKRLAEKHGIEFEWYLKYSFSLEEEGIDELKKALRGVESAQKTLNSIIEKKVNELLNTV